MKKINYVLAKDEDFTKQTPGYFIYTGKEPYIEIPHIIQGVQITSYEAMFKKCSFVRGIKSTNKNVTSAARMFYKHKSKPNMLDLSEFDMTNIQDADSMFLSASIKEIIWPKDKMPLQLKTINLMFFYLKTTTLDLSAFDFSHVTASVTAFLRVEADEIIFPTKGLRQLLAAYDPIRQEPLREIETKFHTEELCWAAVLNNKKQGRYVKIKSKRILMYLGDECPEYIDFYYNR